MEYNGSAKAGYISFCLLQCVLIASLIYYFLSASDSADFHESYIDQYDNINRTDSNICIIPNDNKNNTDFNQDNLTFIETIQKKLDSFTKKLHEQRYEWKYISKQLSSEWNVTNTILYNKTILFMGDSTLRATFSYFIYCICAESDVEFKNNDCRDDRLLIEPNNISGKYEYAIRKGKNPHKHHMDIQCNKYNATMIWYNLWAEDINIKTVDKITKTSNMNISNLTIDGISNLDKDANDILNRLKGYHEKIDILIWNQGLHLQTELRKHLAINRQKLQGENIGLLIYYEFYVDLIKNNVWNKLKRSNKSCLFFQTTQPENCNLMYDDRICLFAMNKNLTYFNKWYTDWNDYLLQCSNVKNIPMEICNDYYHGKAHKPLNIRLRKYVKHNMQKYDSYSKVLLADIGYLLNDTDFCHHNDYIHKLKCCAAKTYFYVNLFDIASC